MRMEYWWDDNDREIWGTKTCPTVPVSLVHLKSHMDLQSYGVFLMSCLNCWLLAALRQSGAMKEGSDLVTPLTALVSVKIGVFWEVTLLFGRLVDIDVSEEPSCFHGVGRRCTQWTEKEEELKSFQTFHVSVVNIIGCVYCENRNTGAAVIGPRVTLRERKLCVSPAWTLGVTCCPQTYRQNVSRCPQRSRQNVLCCP